MSLVSPSPPNSPKVAGQGNDSGGSGQPCLEKHKCSLKSVGLITYWSPGERSEPKRDADAGMNLEQGERGKAQTGEPPVSLEMA